MAIVSYPNEYRNYCIFDEQKAQAQIKKGDKGLEEIRLSLSNPKTEDEVVEDLFILNRMLDEGVDKQKINNIYSELSKYNSSKSPNIQTYLAGIYRKTKIPDGFGPLVAMLIQNSINPPKDAKFDPNEEIGGAILDYLA